MKRVPSHISEPPPQPTPHPLRQRMRGLLVALGRWGKRLALRDQPTPTSASAASRAAPPDAGTLAASLGESARSRLPTGEREQSATRSRPIRRVAPTQARATPRPYLTEGLPSARSARLADDQRRPTLAGADQPPHPASQAGTYTPGIPPLVDAAPADAPAEPLAVPTEETRRALARNLLKGTRNGMLLTLEPGYAWAQVLEVLAARLEESPSFFQGALLSLDTRRRPLQPDEMDQLEALLAPYDMAFKEVGSGELNDPRILPSGAVRELPPGSGAADLPIRPGRDATDMLLTRRTVRSGQRLRYEHGVVVIGDVNAGAEVIARGDVIVWGTLRGTVHAGYPGNEKAIVCALVLAPVQLRIGALASRPPEDESPPPQTPEVASVKNGLIVVESWNAGRALRR